MLLPDAKTKGIAVVARPASCPDRNEPRSILRALSARGTLTGSVRRICRHPQGEDEASIGMPRSDKLISAKGCGEPREKIKHVRGSAMNSPADQGGPTCVRDAGSDVLISMLAGHFGAQIPAPAGKIDGGRFLALVRQHRIARLLTADLVEAARLPPEIVEGLHKAQRAAAFRAVAMQAETLRLAEAFRANGVDMLVLKGVVFGQQFHGDASARASRDIDLLVRGGDLAPAQAVLADLGYRQHTPALIAGVNALEFQSAHALHPVELHVDLHDSPQALPASSVWTGNVTVDILIAGGRVTALKPEFAIVYAAVHGSKHFWRRLLWIGDMAAAVRSGRIDWAEAWTHACRHSSERHLALGLALAQSVLGVPLPQPIALDRRATRRAQTYAGWIVPSIASSLVNTDAQAVRSLGPLRSLRLILGLSKSPGAKLDAMREILRPTYGDRDSIALPGMAAWAYYAVRLWRLARRYGLRE